MRTRYQCTEDAIHLPPAGAMPRVYIGRTHDLYGKSLWELLCNLKDFGVGRVIKRTKLNRRYPEASWFRVISAQPEMDQVRPHRLVLGNTGPRLQRGDWMVAM